MKSHIEIVYVILILVTMRSPFLAALLLFATPILSSPTPDNKNDGCTTTVKHGSSIQSAINKAKPGDKIIVEAGTYAEQLTIKTSGLTLIGKNAILVPPEHFGINLCSGLNQDFVNVSTEAGICIHGKGVDLAPYVKEHRRFISAKEYIKNVVVSGFTVKNFTGENIAVVAGSNVKIIDNKLINGAQYGFLTVGSKDTLAQGNLITTAVLPSFIAMCMDDQSGAVFKGNNISNYLIGLCGQTSGGLLAKNTVKDCCVGAFVDPFVKNLKVLDNTFSDRPALCPAELGGGVIVLGAVKATVKGNVVKGFTNSGMGVGILIMDDADTGAKASGNVVKKNKLEGNDFDIADTSAAAASAGNVLANNQCDPALASPATACS